jgi:hypothetical protein
MAADSEEAKWLGIIGRCLAYLCLKNSDVAGADRVDQAAFLEKLGLDVDEQAALVGSSSASLKEMLRRAKLKTKGGRGAKAKR